MDLLPRPYRGSSASLLWGRVEDADGRRAVSRLRTPEGYTLTARTSVEAVRRVLAGEAPAGFQTPPAPTAPTGSCSSTASSEDVE